MTEKNTKKAIPISERGLPELISKSGSPRIGMGFIPIWGPTCMLEVNRHGVGTYLPKKYERRFFRAALNPFSRYAVYVSLPNSNPQSRVVTILMTINS